MDAALALAADEDDRIVFLSDLWLDRPATLTRLRAVLTGAHARPKCRARAALTSLYQLQHMQHGLCPMPVP